MSNLQLLRLVAAFNLFSVLIINLTFRIHAATGESLSRRCEGYFMLVTLRLCSFGAVAASWLGIFEPEAIPWAMIPLPLWVRWTGAALTAATPALLIWTLRNLGGNVTDTIVTRRQHTLVGSGPYRWVRHPYYILISGWLLGLAIASANGLAIVMSMLLFALFTRRTFGEEELLIQRFGSAYRNYVERTGRFFPLLFRSRHRHKPLNSQ